MDNTSDHKILIHAWNNKGVCFNGLGITKESVLTGSEGGNNQIIILFTVDQTS